MILRFALAFLLLFAVRSLVSAQCAKGTERLAPLRQDFEQRVLALTNAERRKQGLKALRWEDKLAFAARHHAKDMATKDYFNHSSHDRIGGKLVKTCDFATRLRAFYGRARFSAENIALGQASPEEVVRAWLNSPGHRRNMLNPKAEFLGVGYATNAKGRAYWVQNFGTPF